MSFWEAHQKMIFVVSGFLVGLLGLWFFLLSGYAAAEQKNKEEFDEVITKDYKKYTDGDIPVGMSNNEMRGINRVLAERYAGLREELHFAFPDPLIPPTQLDHHRVYVRQELAGIQKDIEKDFAQARGIIMPEAALTLGFTIPEEANEPLTENLKWLREMEVIKHFFYTVLKPIHSDRAGRNILRIDLVKALPPVQITPSIREFPVRFTCQMSLRGVMRLLKLCSGPAKSVPVTSPKEKAATAKGNPAADVNSPTKKSAVTEATKVTDAKNTTPQYAILNLEIDGMPQERTAETVERINQQKREKVMRRAYYYQVTFVVSRLAIETKMKAAKPVSTASGKAPPPRALKPIPH